MQLVITQDAYTDGKRAFLSGKGKTDYPHQMSDAAAHDFRMGWLAAQSNKECHPDWGDNYILATCRM